MVTESLRFLGAQKLGQFTLVFPQPRGGSGTQFASGGVRAMQIWYAKYPVAMASAIQVAVRIGTTRRMFQS